MAPPVSPRTVRLNRADNVVVAIDAIEAGSCANKTAARERIPRGHKMAVARIELGAPILKFGQIIGFASSEIQPGDFVHEHNCSMREFERPSDFARDAAAEEVLSRDLQATFRGFSRANGRVGTRNYIGILTSVNCSATVARYIADEVTRSGMLADYEAIDGIVPIVHGTGCGISTRGEPFDVLTRTLWGYAANPNMGAVLVVGLGCEALQIDRLKRDYSLAESDTFRSFTIQDFGGTRRSVLAGVEIVREMLPQASLASREVTPVSELVLALQCGASDGYSALTANPALGATADILVRHGGTAILSETPEIYGAEHLLARRAESPAVAVKLLDRIEWWKDYAARRGCEMNANPSPGNKAGGLTTILEKSLGAVMKAGTTTLRAVYEYAQPVDRHGFVFMDTPGFDPVSATGQIAGGANILCFTTGRGSAYGSKPTPSIKLATNSDIYRRMIDDMDINCGDILDGTPIEQKGQEIFETIQRVASGERTKSELLGYGDAEFVPWQIGPTM